MSIKAPNSSRGTIKQLTPGAVNVEVVVSRAASMGGKRTGGACELHVGVSVTTSPAKPAACRG